MKAKKCIVFDLDDTLFKEEEFVFSAFRYILNKYEIQNDKNLYFEMVNRFRNRVDVFDWFIAKINTENRLNLTIETVLSDYRHHYPDIAMDKSDFETLIYLKNKQYYLSVVTDGRSITQRNKIEALGLNALVDYIVISQEIGSEKPNISNFQSIIENLSADEYIYVGDNVKKDFIGPHLLGWKTYCLKNNGLNIHVQDLNELNSSTVVIQSINELQNYL